MNSTGKPAAVVLLVVGIFIFVNSIFIVDETEQVVVTQFKKIVGEPVVDPGLKFKIPFIQKANYFPKNLLQWDGDPDQINTRDKKYIVVDTFARWRIVDPIKYFETIRDEFAARKRLGDIIDPAIRNLITSYPLVESVRNTDRSMDTFEDADEGEDRVQYKVDLGRNEITRQIEVQASAKLIEFGIELVDVKIKRINYIDSVRESVYDRMIAERNQIAEKVRAEGRGEASKIRGDKEKELQQIRSEAYKTAQTIKGEADARAARIYADAYNVDPDFYSFIHTLETYKISLNRDSTLVLSTDSDFMKYLKNFE